MKTNCELPLCLMVENYDLNDFDFVLYHLYTQHPEYALYYNVIKMADPNRFMILDNSAYEFFVQGKKLNMKKFVEAINNLKPDYYILPDVLQDKKKTVAGIKRFLKTYTPQITCGAKPMAVAQGSTSEELVECLEMFREMSIDYVGIPFHLDFYRDSKKQDDIENEFMSYYGKTNPDLEYAMGRVQWVRDHEVLLKSFDKVHFLGSHCPLEKEFYKDYYSMDTGYPVKLGVEYVTMFQETSKPTTLIDDFLKKDLDDIQVDNIRRNINMFKQL